MILLKMYRLLRMDMSYVLMKLGVDIRVQTIALDSDNQNIQYGHQAAILNITSLNTLRPRQNDHHFPEDVFKCILNETIGPTICRVHAFSGDGTVLPSTRQALYGYNGGYFRGNDNDRDTWKDYSPPDSPDLLTIEEEQVDLTGDAAEILKCGPKR